MLSDKYLAGFVDADGYMGVRARIGARPDLEFRATQNHEWTEPLAALQEQFGGVMSPTSDGGSMLLAMRGGPARKLFERLKPYLVLKRDHARLMLDLVDRGVVLNTRDDVQAVRQRVREIRGYGATFQPNFPARKWMAGYVDGDGSFVVQMCRKTGYAYPLLNILAAPNYVVGVLLLHKAFGGRMQAMGQNAVWSVQLSQPSKIEQVVGHCAKYLVRKQAQAYFLLGCARGGNLRDGETIHRTMKALNAQQHRLSDPAATAARLLQDVRFDIEPRRLGRPPGVIETRPRQKRQSNLQM